MGENGKKKKDVGIESWVGRSIWDWVESSKPSYVGIIPQYLLDERGHNLHSNRGEGSGCKQTSHHRCVQDFQHWLEKIEATI